MGFLQGLFSGARPPAKPRLEGSAARLLDLFDAAGSVVVLAGGSMAPGGDPGGDGPGPEPIRYRHFLIDESARREQWRRSLSEARAFAAAQPAAGHVALASIAQARRLKVVTLSRDGLLSRAGMHVDDMVELHGRGDGAVCTACGRRTPIEAHAADIEAGRSPACTVDGRILKPSGALHGEPPLRSAAVRAEEWAHACDLFLAVGTGLGTIQASRLALEARAVGARVARLGPGAGLRDVAPDLSVEADASVTLAALAG